MRAAWNAQFPFALNIETSSACTLEYAGRARVGDVVALLVGSLAHIGELHSLGHVEVRPGIFQDYACVELWTPIRAGSRYYKVMRETSDPYFVALDCLQGALTVQRHSKCTVCIIPAVLRTAFGDVANP